ncbi:helix-turn-helix domain-containing protein [Sciscionella marina]|uniref:helix-turn-helix domain-containing protein n=1 Tax=Sciscionella marina TaxID=508770 RepID=UPI001F08E33A|nr:helix-turn-helix domain-containing protein [Sciscionella marina]
MRRARLLDAATSAFAKRGFHGTTTPDIAETAGMNPAALYVHHKSKEELVYLISRSGHETPCGSSARRSTRPGIRRRRGVPWSAISPPTTHRATPGHGS